MFGGVPFQPPLLESRKLERDLLLRSEDHTLPTVALFSDLDTQMPGSSSLPEFLPPTGLSTFFFLF